MIRVAATVEHAWHTVPGGTGVAARELLCELVARTDEVEVVGVAGRHEGPAPNDWLPAIPIHHQRGHGASLYAQWLWAGRPKVESSCGAVDVAHALTIIPCPARAPLVVTVHDLAFRHLPQYFTRWGRVVFERSLELIRRRAALVLCSSQATLDDCVAAGIDPHRLRLVPLGVDQRRATDDERAEVADRYSLPDEYVLFVGTLEPRKNLATLVSATTMPIIVVGPAGWGDTAGTTADHVRFLGYVPSADLPAIYANASVFCMPSLWEGFGLPVAEALVQGTPVVTSERTSMAEITGAAGVLIDPRSVDSVAAGIDEAIGRRVELGASGPRRAAAFTWAHTADLVLDAYREVMA